MFLRIIDVHSSLSFKLNIRVKSRLNVQKRRVDFTLLRMYFIHSRFFEEVKIRRLLTREIPSYFTSIKELKKETYNLVFSFILRTAGSPEVP